MKDERFIESRENDQPGAMNGQRIETPSPLAQDQSGRRFSRLRNLIVGVLIGSAVGLVGTIGLLIYLNRGQLPIMKPGDFQAAERRWKERGPVDYVMDLQQVSDTKEAIHVEVRNNEVIDMTLGGRQTAKRLWPLWSVPGLFEFIRIDLKRNENAEKDPAARSSQPVMQQAEFDTDGLPRAYRRTELATGEVGGWSIVSFKVGR